MASDAKSFVPQLVCIEDIRGKMSRRGGAKRYVYYQKGENPLSRKPQHLGISTPQFNREQLMASGDISISLVFEPRGNAEGGPVLIARVDDPFLIVRAARAAIGAAQKRAAELRGVDELIGEFESAEAARLQALLTLLVPGLGRARDEGEGGDERD
jgi:hypothetical protein